MADSKTMCAVTIERFGGPEVLSVSDVAIPRPGPGEVTIDVAYAGVNFAEVMYRRGAIGVALPFTPGIEVSGHVREIGPGDTEFAVGDAVVALTITDSGGYAEVVCVNSQLVAAIPGDDLDAQRLQIYAAMPSNTVTAVLLTEHVARTRPGDAVLVHAAAGGFGTQFGQVARMAGIKSVTGTVGTKAKSRSALEHGYTRVVVRANSQADLGDAEFDVIIDPVGGANRTRDLERLAPGGRLIAMGNASGGEDSKLSANTLWFASAGIIGHSTLAFARRRPRLVKQALDKAVAHVAAKDITVPIHSLYDLDDAASAQRVLEAGGTTGKIVLAVRRS
ncbi:zinc-binding dehydrogenase [Williamsia sp.]|uniref:quinone oxidoreductase family protein n=1 Tax=Williamsia sp. TaxID=1872085 RepID=UPI001A24B728|nr:zinc-binding dehydrogenase [Williamsia sp.]MBJ7289685.1 zinc-binding dehydrogenase [Williamsia sp.]